MPAPAAAADADADTDASAEHTASSSAKSDGHVPASGFARAEAEAKGIDLSTVASSRTDGYITSADLMTVGTATPGGGGGRRYTPAPGVIHATPTARMEAKKQHRYF